MEFTSKLAAARQWLDASGIAPGTAAPPFFRLCWRLGIPVAPPHFRGCVANALSLGSFFGIIWSLCMAGMVAIGVLPHRPMPLQEIVTIFVLAALAASVMFGFCQIPQPELTRRAGK